MMNKKKLVVSLILVGVMMLLTGCIQSVRGSGEVVSRTFEIEDFNALDIRGGYHVVWRQSDNVAVTIEMQENLFEFLQVSVAGETLRVNSTRNFSTSRGNSPRIYVYTPYLEMVNFYGAVNASDWDIVQGEKFQIQGAGAINVILELEVDTIDINLSGAGNLNLSGTADSANIITAGASNVLATQLQIRDVNVELSGAGDIDVAVSDNLSVELFGAGRVRYTGNPTIARTILGVGRVVQR